MQKRIVLIALLTLFISCSPTKKVNHTALLSKYLEKIDTTRMKEDLTVIASDDMQGRETGSEGQKKAGRYIIESYERYGIKPPSKTNSYYQTVPAEFLNAKRNENLPDSENILAFIEGSDKKNEIVVLSAHYDHIGIRKGEIHNGADDDGSGTVAIMEIARAFQNAKNNGNGPRRSVLILHVTGEEHGLHGSRYYSENPVFPLENTVADVNIDMIGRRDEFHLENNKYIYLIGSDYLSTDLYNICENVNNKYKFLQIDYKYNDRNDKNKFYYRSDHYNFAKNGIPSVFLFSGVHSDYHKPGDDVEKIEFDALSARTKLAFAITWEIANREDRLIVDKSDGK